MNAGNRWRDGVERLPQALAKRLSALRNQTAKTALSRMTSRHVAWVIVLSVLFVAVVLRAYRIGTFPGLNPDEVEVALQWFRPDPIFWYAAPSGRPHVNFLAPLLLFPFVFAADAALWVVRMPALIVGIALLPVAFVALRRTFELATAQAVTVLAAALPIHIAYSRLGWDPSYVPLIVMTTIGFALAGRWSYAGLSFLVALAIHPTCIFFAPVLVALALLPRWQRRHESPKQALATIVLGAVCLEVLIYFSLVFIANSEEIALNRENVPLLAGVAFERALDLPQLADFLLSHALTLAGPLVYETFVGAPDVPELWGGYAVVMGLIVAGGSYWLWSQKRFRELCMVLGLAVGLYAQFVAMGTSAVSLLRERYVLWSSMPTILCAWFIARAFAQQIGKHRLAQALAFATSIVLLTQFFLSYILVFEKTGGKSSVLDYRSSSTAPKMDVVRLIAEEYLDEGEVAVVFVGNIRVHLCLFYLASPHSNVEIVNLNSDVFYPHFQTEGIGRLEEVYSNPPVPAQRYFFVDYAWDHGFEAPGAFEPSTSEPERRSIDIVFPWSGDHLETLHAGDETPLFAIWELFR